MVHHHYSPSVVHSAQKPLDTLGYDLGPTGVDDDFGHYTRKAIEAFEKDHKLPVTGHITPALLTHLHDAVEQKKTSVSRTPTQTVAAEAPTHAQELAAHYKASQGGQQSAPWPDAHNTSGVDLRVHPQSQQAGFHLGISKNDPVNSALATAFFAPAHPTQVADEKHKPGAAHAPNPHIQALADRHNGRGGHGHHGGSPSPLGHNTLYVTSGFGDRIHPLTGESQFHAGVDLRAPADAPVYATVHGKVIAAGAHNKGTGGPFVVIRGDDGRTYRYFDLDPTLNVKQGDTVAPGQQIAAVGNHTGKETGPHLHYEVLTANGACINPVTTFASSIRLSGETNLAVNEHHHHHGGPTQIADGSMVAPGAVPPGGDDKGQTFSK